MCLRAGVCVTNGLLLPGYLRLAMELQSQARVDKYCWHHAHSQRLPCPAGLCQPQPGRARYVKIRESGLWRGEAGPLVSRSRRLSEPRLSRSMMRPLPTQAARLACCVSLGCVYGEARGRMGHRMQASLVTARARPFPGGGRGSEPELRPRVNNKQININSASVARLPPRRHHWFSVVTVLGLDR